MAEIIQGAVFNWTFCGPVLVAFQVDGITEPDRFALFIEELTGRENVGYCLGGAWGAAKLTSRQRRQVTEILKGVPTAVVVNHSVARGVLTAMGWLGLNVKGFAWGAVEKAAAFLRLPPDLAKESIATYRDLVTQSLPPGHPGLEPES